MIKNPQNLSNNKPPSNLSRGPTNPNHATYRRNGNNINKALCKRISVRHVNVRAMELCQDAGVTPPTFYLHYRNSNDALASYEFSIENEVYNNVPLNAKREVFFVMLISHIFRNRQYFLAAQQGGSYYLLQKIFYHYRKSLTGRYIGDRSFAAYVGTLIATVNCWLKFDKLTKASAAQCAQKLRNIRVMRVE